MQQTVVRNGKWNTTWGAAGIRSAVANVRSQMASLISQGHHGSDPRGPVRCVGISTKVLPQMPVQALEALPVFAS